MLRLRAHHITPLVLFLALVCSVGIVQADKYIISYNSTSNLTDNLFLNYANTVSNATVTFTGVGIGGNFDNANGGSWQKWAGFKFTSSTSEYAQYKVTINGTSWYMYNASGALKGSGTVNDFWNSTQSDGDDIRVFNQNRDQLYFWLENFDYTNQTATIWVKLTASSTELDIAYGNQNATQSSYEDVTQVFEFYDDFEDQDFSDWTIYSGTWQITTNAYNSNYALKRQTTGTPATPIGHAYNYDRSYDIVIEFAVKLTENAGTTPFGFVIRDKTSDNGYVFSYGRGSTACVIKKWVNGSSGTTIASGTSGISANQWYLTKITIKTDGTIIFEPGNGDTITASDNTYTSFDEILPRPARQSIWDEFRVYKLSDPANVSNFQTGTFQTQNPRVIINNNTVGYNGSLNQTQSVTLSINSSYFTQGDNEIKILTDSGETLTRIEFDYAFNITVTTTDHYSYISKTIAVNIPENSTYAQGQYANFTISYPKRTADYNTSVSAAHTISESPNTIYLNFNLSTPITTTINSEVGYLIANITVKDEITGSSINPFTISWSGGSKSGGNVKLYGTDFKTSLSEISIDVSASGYKTRKQLLDTTTLNQNETYYLLSNTESTLVTFYIISNNYGVPQAKITIYKTTHKITSLYTDGQGIAFTYLKYGDTYSLTVEKAGFNTLNTTLTISQTTYYLYLSTSSFKVTITPNVFYAITPSGNTLPVGAVTIYFQIIPKGQIVDSMSLTVYNNSSVILGTASASSFSSAKTISVSITTTGGGTYIAVGSFTVDGASYTVKKTYVVPSSVGLWAAFSTLKNALENASSSSNQTLNPYGNPLALLIAGMIATAIVVVMATTRAIPSRGLGLIGAVVFAIIALPLGVSTGIVALIVALGIFTIIVERTL